MKTGNLSLFGLQASSLGRFSMYLASFVVVVVVLVLAVSGCGRIEQNSAPPAVLTGMHSEQLTCRGQLHFVKDVAAGCSLAAEKNLPCLLFFTADWCTYCHEMEDTAFADPAVATGAESFICVLVDADREKELCQQFSVTGYPTIQFVSSRGRKLNRLVGRQSASELVAGMRAALKRYAWLNDPVKRL